MGHMENICKAAGCVGHAPARRQREAVAYVASGALKKRGFVFKWHDWIKYCGRRSVALEMFRMDEESFATEGLQIIAQRQIIQFSGLVCPVGISA